MCRSANKFTEYFLKVVSLVAKARQITQPKLIDLFHIVWSLKQFSPFVLCTIYILYVRDTYIYANNAFYFVFNSTLISSRLQLPVETKILFAIFIYKYLMYPVSRSGHWHILRLGIWRKNNIWRNLTLFV